jgi:hypothetical protein
MDAIRSHAASETDEASTDPVLTTYMLLMAHRTLASVIALGKKYRSCDGAMAGDLLVGQGRRGVRTTWNRADSRVESGRGQSSKCVGGVRAFVEMWRTGGGGEERAWSV